jgi:C4-type Zn-finger protein
MVSDGRHRPSTGGAFVLKQRRKGRMDDLAGKRTCPDCGSGDYTFRGRKQIEATPEHGPLLETKYACRSCENVWKERVPGELRKPPPRE